MKIIDNTEIFSERQLFAHAVQAGEFTFVAQDARNADGALTADSANKQAELCLRNLDVVLRSTGQSIENIASLTIYLPNHEHADAVAQVLRQTFTSSYPAVNFVGVAGLEGGCRVRMDAVATTSRDREPLRVAELPLSIGAGCHGVRVGDFYFLSGVDASDDNGRINAAPGIQAQTTAVLTRIKKILATQQLALKNLCRTFMFMPGTKHRPGYGEARKKIYDGSFREDEFPPNSGIYIPTLGENILLRSQAIAYRGAQRIVTSPKVRLAPGSFSQSARVGDWLLLAGQDAVTFDRVVECEGSLAGQTEATLRHTRDIVEAAGGTLDDIVKTTVYLTKGSNRVEFVQAYREFFVANGRAQPLPSGFTVVVDELSPRCFVEIDSVAYLGK